MARQGVCPKCGKKTDLDKIVPATTPMMQCPSCNEWSDEYDWLKLPKPGKPPHDPAQRA